MHGALIQRNMFGNINAPFWLKSCHPAFELPKDLGASSAGISSPQDLFIYF
jgi:hypothetical protein